MVERANSVTEAGQAVEAGLMLVALILVCVIVFGGWVPKQSAGVLVHARGRLGCFSLWPTGNRDRHAGRLCLCYLGTLHGFGPFARESPNESLLVRASFHGRAGRGGLGRCRGRCDGAGCGTFAPRPRGTPSLRHGGSPHGRLGMALATDSLLWSASLEELHAWRPERSAVTS